MTRNLSDKPHQTPHPDQPHAIGPAKERNSPTARLPEDEADPDVPTYDSCFDDLNKSLTEAVNEPDPNLDTVAMAGTSSPSARIDDSVTGVVSDRGRQPRTSEVFQAVGPSVVDVPSTMPGSNLRLQSILSADSPDELPRVELTPDRLTATDAGIEEQGSPPFPWTHLLLLSYSSALTLALIWAVWHGWLQRPHGSQPADSSSSEVEAVTNVPGTKPPVPTPPIPPENLVKLGETIRIGELDVTPLSVITTPLTLVRSIEPTTERPSAGSSLVLRLRLANVSQYQTFAPLERGMLRAPNSPLDRSFIETPKGRTISLYPLAADSEWTILGQDFPEIKPRESVETIIASEPLSEIQSDGEMTWRVRLRIGSYRTDMVGVRFTKDDIASLSSDNPRRDEDSW
jgi:hypothetical protein